MEVALRGLGTPMSSWNYGDANSNMACYLDPDCHDYANVVCYGPLFFARGCASWRAFAPTPGQIVANDTNAGPALTQANKDLATQEAQGVIAADIAAHPENYGALCPSGTIPQTDGSCVPCPTGQSPSNGVCVASFDWSSLATGVLLLGLGFLIFMVKK
jgi:hypothetical protein